MEDRGEILVLELNYRWEEPIALYPVLLNDPVQRILIDCGYPGSLPLLERALLARGLGFAEVDAIALTHHDIDHYGALAEIKEKYPHILALSSELDADPISGRKKSLRLLQAEALYHTLSEEERGEARRFEAELRAVVPVPVGETLRDGQFLPLCGGVEVVATPGHMPGHLSFYLRKYRSLITGDALVAIDGRLRIANPRYAIDIAEARRSVAKLEAFDIETYICYHGGVVHVGPHPRE